MDNNFKLSEPLVSIIMTCYNNCDSLKDAISSIINQSYQNYTPLYLYIKLKNQVKPGSRFSYASFEKKLYSIKNSQNPFYLLLFPNYEWANLIVGFNQIQ